VAFPAFVSTRPAEFPVARIVADVAQGAHGNPLHVLVRRQHLDLGEDEVIANLPLVRDLASCTKLRRRAFIAPGRGCGSADPAAREPFLPETVLLSVSDCLEELVLIALEDRVDVVALLGRVNARP
jgi:hypothetical protein